MAREMYENPKVGIYPELKSALAGNLVLSSRSQNTTVEQLLINILHRWADKVRKIVLKNVT